MEVAAQHTPRGKRRLLSKTSPSATASSAGTPGTVLDSVEGTPDTDPRGGSESPAFEAQIELPETAVDAGANITGDACEKLRLSKAWYNKFAYWKRGQVRACRNEEAKKRFLASLVIRGTTWKQKSAVLQKFLASIRSEDDIRAETLRAIAFCLLQQNKAKHHFRKNVALLTYQGSWGVLEVDAEKLSAVFALDADPLQPPEDHEHVVVNMVADAVRDMVAFEDLQQKMNNFVEGFVKQHHADSWAYSLELCPKTLLEKRVVRVHAHMYIAKHTAFRLKDPSALVFMETTPVEATTVVIGTSTRATSRNFAGLYYYVAKKVGSIYRQGSHEPFTGFPVNLSWPESAASRKNDL